MAAVSFEFPARAKFREEAAAAAVGGLDVAADADEEVGGGSGYTRFRSRFRADVMSLQKRHYLKLTMVVASFKHGSDLIELRLTWIWRIGFLGDLLGFLENFSKNFGEFL